MSYRTLPILLALVTAACGAPDPNARSVTAQFDGTPLTVIWSPEDQKKATVILADWRNDRLPVEAKDSAEFKAFFAAVTGCRVRQGEPVVVTHTDRPFSLIVPKDCG